MAHTCNCCPKCVVVVASTISVFSWEGPCDQCFGPLENLVCSVVVHMPSWVLRELNRSVFQLFYNGRSDRILLPVKSLPSHCVVAFVPLM